jgi:hypothetical protein
MRIDVSSAGPPQDLLHEMRSLGSTAPWSEDRERSLANRILEAVAASGGNDEELIQSVFDLTIHPNPKISQRGQRILFSTIAETLGDAFDVRAVGVHDRVLSSVIEFCRHHPGLPFFDSRLRSFGIANREDCLARKAKLVHPRPLTAGDRASIRKVCVLSRVTLGADVAVTSIVLQKVGRLFPRAETRLIGPAAAGQVLAGLAGTLLIECEYERRGLIDRLRSWHEVVQIVEQETSGLEDQECLVIDPDSRLTQLGLLPIARATIPYLFFESRAYRATGLETLGELTQHWLNHVLSSDDDESTWPQVALSSRDVSRAGAIVRALERRGGVVAMNLGVGGNARKRIHGSFEVELARAILAAGSALLIDYGAGEDEARVASIVDSLRSDGREVGDLDGKQFGETSLPSPRCDVLAHRGPVGPFAALVGASDLYVGYDSAFQHIAGAQGVPVIDIFVDPPNPLFPARWRPHSTASVITVEAKPQPSDSNDTLAVVLDAIRDLRNASSRRP